MVDDGTDRRYAGIVEILKRCLPVMVIEALAEAARARFSGSLVLRFHEGKVHTYESRVVHACDARHRG